MTVTAGISWRAQGELLVFVSALTPQLVFHFLRSSAGRSAAPTPNPCFFFVFRLLDACTLVNLSWPSARRSRRPDACVQSIVLARNGSAHL
ncbi:hypothetical protein BD310DRAFT_916672, partial [Dichomitus squalens]